MRGIEYVFGAEHGDELPKVFAEEIDFENSEGITEDQLTILRTTSYHSPLCIGKPGTTFVEKLNFLTMVTRTKCTLLSTGALWFFCEELLNDDERERLATF